MGSGTSVVEDVATCVGRALHIEDRARGFTAQTGLLGEQPEFDSMAVLAVITEIEEVFGFEIEEDEITADLFESVGALATFVEARLTDA